MTPSRSTISRGALLVALMAGSTSLAGGAAHADVLGGAGPIPLPAPIPTVPLLGEPSPSPSPTSSSAPAPEPAPTTSTQNDASASTTSSDAAPAPASDSTSASSSGGTNEVAASTATAPAPVAAPAPAEQAPAARPVAAQPISVAGPALPATATSVRTSTGAAPQAALPQAASPLKLPAAAPATVPGSFSGFPQLSAGSMQLPSLPQLPGLRPMIAPQPLQLAPLLSNGPSLGGVPVVRTAHSMPVQPGSSTGIVLFVMASAAGAAGLARVRIYRSRVIHG